eukprot:scaffold9114_cov118-Isochrysis_galbana.AAC.20
MPGDVTTGRGADCVYRGRRARGEHTWRVRAAAAAVTRGCCSGRAVRGSALPRIFPHRGGIVHRRIAFGGQVRPGRRRRAPGEGPCAQPAAAALALSPALPRSR